MKNTKATKYAAAAAAVCAALLVLGCGTIAASIARQASAGTIVYDQSLPPEESTLVAFGDTIYVMEYNGIAVREAWYPDGKYRINRVTLPAGETSILFDYRSTVRQGDYTYTLRGNGIELRFNFEAGKEYTVGIYSKSLGLFVGSEYGVAIWDFVSQSGPIGGGEASRIIKSWKLGEF
jgi:hypothetical protein